MGSQGFYYILWLLLEVSTMHLLSILPHSNYTGAVVCLPQDTLERWRKDVMRCSVMQLLHLNLATF